MEDHLEEQLLDSDILCLDNDTQKDQEEVGKMEKDVHAKRGKNHINQEHPF